MVDLFGILLLAAAAGSADTPCALQQAAAHGNSAWLLCDEPLLLVTGDKGETWQKRPLPSGHQYRTVFMLDETRGFVAGEGGTLLATGDGGRQWQPVKLPVSENLNALYFLGKHGWAGGWSGVILHSEDGGRNWTRQPTGVAQAVESIYFHDEMHGWAVGWMGLILRTADGGKTWQPAKTSGMLWSLSSVYFRDERNGWAVGFGGQILRSRDGGVTWQEQPSEVKTWFTSVLFDRAGRGWITGEREMFTTTDGGETWHSAPVEDALFLRKLIPAQDGLWAVGHTGVWRQAGAGWTRLTTFPAAPGDSRLVSSASQPPTP